MEEKVDFSFYMMDVRLFINWSNRTWLVMSSIRKTTNFLARKCHQFDESFVTNCTGGCHFGHLLFQTDLGKAWDYFFRHHMTRIQSHNIYHTRPSYWLLLIILHLRGIICLYPGRCPISGSIYSTSGYQQGHHQHATPSVPLHRK